MAELEQFFDLMRQGNTLDGLSRLMAVPPETQEPRVTLNMILYAPGEPQRDEVVSHEQERHLTLLATARGPRRDLLLYNLGCFALFQDDVMEARLRFEEVVAEQPGNLYARHNLALAHELMADFDAARAGYGDVLAQDPGFVLSRLNLALLDMHLGDLAAGRDALRGLVREQPDNMGALLYLCRALLKGGQPVAAREVLGLLGERHDWRHYPDLRECYAFALYLCDENEEAEAELRALLAEDDRNRFARQGLIRLLARRGAFAELREHAERLHALFPSFETRALVERLRQL